MHSTPFWIMLRRVYIVVLIAPFFPIASCEVHPCEIRRHVTVTEPGPYTIAPGKETTMYTFERRTVRESVGLTVPHFNSYSDIPCMLYVMMQQSLWDSTLIYSLETNAGPIVFASYSKIQVACCVYPSVYNTSITVNFTSINKTRILDYKGDGSLLVYLRSFARVDATTVSLCCQLNRPDRVWCNLISANFSGAFSGYASYIYPKWFIEVIQPPNAQGGDVFVYDTIAPKPEDFVAFAYGGILPFSFANDSRLYMLGETGTNVYSYFLQTHNYTDLEGITFTDYSNTYRSFTAEGSMLTYDLLAKNWGFITCSYAAVATASLPADSYIPIGYEMSKVQFSGDKAYATIIGQNVSGTNNSHGIIVSPGFPCTLDRGRVSTHIKLREGRIKFTLLQNDLTNDHGFLYDGGTAESPAMLRLGSHAKMGATVTSCSSHVLIGYSSEVQDNKTQGFQLMWEHKAFHPVECRKNVSLLEGGETAELLSAGFPCFLVQKCSTMLSVGLDYHFLQFEMLDDHTSVGNQSVTVEEPAGAVLFRDGHGWVWVVNISGCREIWHISLVRRFLLLSSIVDRIHQADQRAKLVLYLSFFGKCFLVTIPATVTIADSPLMLVFSSFRFCLGSRAFLIARTIQLKVKTFNVHYLHSTEAARMFDMQDPDITSCN